MHYLNKNFILDMSNSLNFHELTECGTNSCLDLNELVTELELIKHEL